jgi:hypothetical protein
MSNKVKFFNETNQSKINKSSDSNNKDKEFDASIYMIDKLEEQK